MEKMVAIALSALQSRTVAICLLVVIFVAILVVGLKFLILLYKCLLAAFSGNTEEAREVDLEEGLLDLLDTKEVGVSLASKLMGCLCSWAANTSAAEPPQGTVITKGVYSKRLPKLPLFWDNADGHKRVTYYSGYGKYFVTKCIRDLTQEDYLDEGTGFWYLPTWQRNRVYLYRLKTYLETHVKTFVCANGAWQTPETYAIGAWQTSGTYALWVKHP